MAWSGRLLLLLMVNTWTPASTDIWSYTTIWSPYYSYWPVVYQIRKPVASTERAQNRLFPSSSSKTNKLEEVTNSLPEHRMDDDEEVTDNEAPVAEHRFYSYMSSSPSPYSSVGSSGRLKKRSTVTADLPVSSTSVVFPSDKSKTQVGEVKGSKSRGKQQPAKTEGKLVLEGLSLLSSLLRPGASVFRPGLFSSGASMHHPFFGSGISSQPPSALTALYNYPSYSPHPLVPFFYPAASSLYPNAVYPPPAAAATSPYYSTNPYQALSVDNLLVPLVGMVGLNLLRPDIVRSRREGSPSDIDGIDVFREISLDDGCLRRVACEAGVLVTTADDQAAIRRAIERALAARRLVPNSLQATSVQRAAQCAHHTCRLWQGDAAVNKS